MMKYFLVFTSVLLGIIAFSEDLKTNDGKIYREYVVSLISERGLLIDYEKGWATIPFEKLPSDLRKKYYSYEKKYNDIKNEKLKKTKKLTENEKKLKKFSKQVKFAKIVDVQKDFVVCLCSCKNDSFYCVVTDVPDIENIKIGDILKANIPSVDNTVYNKHKGFLITRKDKINIRTEKNKKGVGLYEDKYIYSYCVKCKNCIARTSWRDKKEDALKDIESMNKRNCISYPNITPAHLEIYDTCKKILWEENSEIKIYTYSKKKALDLLREGKIKDSRRSLKDFQIIQ